MYYRKEINMLNTLDEKIAEYYFRNGFKTKCSSKYIKFFYSKILKNLRKLIF